MPAQLPASVSYSIRSNTAAAAAASIDRFPFIIAQTFMAHTN